MDKWLWAVRVFKSRTLATQACRSGKVRIKGQSVKPSYNVQINEVIEARIGRCLRTVKVLALLDRRVGAKLVEDYSQEVLPPVIAKPTDAFLSPSRNDREPGKGRPTKRDRRDIDRLFKQF